MYVQRYTSLLQLSERALDLHLSVDSREQNMNPIFLKRAVEIVNGIT